jgi:homoserine dehydrogenase
MVAPLKVGIAGLGTVGAAVLRLIRKEQGLLAARCGRPVDVVAFCAKEVRDADLDLTKLRRVADPLSLATDPGIDVFV